MPRLWALDLRPDGGDLVILNDDPRADWEPTPTVTECEFCAWENEHDIWDNSRTGDWEYEFTCKSCGDLNKDHGTREDRGGIAPFLSLLVLGVLMVVAPLVHLFYVPGTLAHLYLILTGGMLLTGLLLCATFSWLHQKGIS